MNEVIYNYFTGFIAGFIILGIGISLILFSSLNNKLKNRKKSNVVITSLYNRIISYAKRMANAKLIIVLIVSTILVVIIFFLSVNAYQYYYNQNYVINSSDENAKNTLHTKVCEIIKGNDNVRLVTETDIADGFIENQYNFSTLCNPQPPSLVSIKNDLSSCKSELNKLIETAANDKELLDKHKIILEETYQEMDKINADKEQVVNDTRRKNYSLDEYKRDYFAERKVAQYFVNEKLANINITQIEVDNAQVRVDRTKWLNQHIINVANYLNLKKNVFLLVN